jgi:hypothetical protein
MRYQFVLLEHLLQGQPSLDLQILYLEEQLSSLHVISSSNSLVKIGLTYKLVKKLNLALKFTILVETDSRV